MTIHLGILTVTLLTCKTQLNLTQGLRLNVVCFFETPTGYKVKAIIDFPPNFLLNTSVEAGQLTRYKLRGFVASG